MLRAFVLAFLQFTTTLPTSPNLKKETPYDFVIIGSGSAGSVIANRLSEIKNWKILLLEAGIAENKLTSIPLLAPMLQFTPYNWGYTTEPQDNFCKAMTNQRCAWPRGRALGGSTVINYMIYTRGNPTDYERWAENNPGWSYSDVLPYFLKSEGTKLNLNRRYHNTTGPLSIEDPFGTEITDAFLQAGVEMGYKIVDYNSPEPLGFAKVQATLKNGRRHSVAGAFLDPIRSRANLKIITSAFATRILINSTNHAYGVEFEHGGIKYRVRPSKEVILCAGAFESPKLLMLSGIGPRKHLEDLNIPVVVDLPVGENLYDHVSFLGLAFKINRTVEPVSRLFDPNELLNYYLKGKGPPASLGGIEALAFINTNSSERIDYPDVELIFVGPGALQADYGLINRRMVHMRDEVYYSSFLPIENIPSWTVFPMLLHPKSKGYLRLASKNPRDNPLFFGNNFDDPRDLKSLLAAIRFVIKLSETPAFQQFNSTLSDVPLFGCENLEFNSDEYWTCALESLTTSLHHQIGTCKMGPDGVVTEKLKVRGIVGLRIADTSIIPVTLSSHTNAPTIMIGERTADFVKESWNFQS